MTYDERINTIGTLLRETILPRYTRPPHLDDETARAELADMVRDLNSEWPLGTQTQFNLIGQALARAIRTTYTGRSWPTIAHMAKALKAAREAPVSALIDRASPTSGDDREGWKRARVKAWLYDGKPIAPDLVTKDRLTAVGCKDVHGAYAFAHDPWNQGVDPELTEKDRERSVIAQNAVINSAPLPF